MSLLPLLVAALLAPGPYRWRVVPLDGGGPVTVVTPSPHDPGVLLAGGERSGFHRSVDGGHTWQTANAGLTSDAEAAVADIAFHPTEPQVVYAAVGVDGSRPGDWGALLASGDGGCSWSVRSHTARFAARGDGRQGGRLLVTDPFYPDCLYAATARDGVLYSEDQGRTWRSLGLEDHRLTALRRAADGTLAAAAIPCGDIRGGVFVRPRGGRWARVFTGAVNDLTLTASQPGRLLIATPDAGLLLSEDYGRSWGHVAPELSRRLLARGVAFAPTHPQVGLAVGVARPGQRRLPDVYLTLDSGHTWQPVPGPEAEAPATGGWNGPDWFAYGPLAVAFGPNTPRRVWLGDALGIWATHDGAASWFSGSRGLRTTAVRAIALDPSDNETAYLGLEGVGAFRVTADAVAATPLGGNADIVRTVEGLAARLETDHTTVYLSRGTSVWRQTEPGGWTGVPGEVPGLLRRLVARPDGALVAEVDGGPPAISRDGAESWQSWSRAPAGMHAPVWFDSTYVRAAALAPGRGVCLTRDGGETWQPAAGELPAGSGSLRDATDLTAIPGDAPVLLAATPQGVWRSRDGGTGWERVHAWPASHLACDPRTHRLYLAGSTAWNLPERRPGLYASDDTGDTWTRIDVDWPVLPTIACLVPDPRYPGRLWVGTDGNGAVVGEPEGP